MTSASLRIDHGVGDAGLTTVQLPAASAGAIFRRHQQREVERDDLATRPAARGSGSDGVLSISVVRPSSERSRRRSSGSGRRRAGCRQPASRGRACRSPRLGHRSISRFSSMRSAMALSTAARSVREDSPMRPSRRARRPGRVRRPRGGARHLADWLTLTGLRSVMYWPSRGTRRRR